MEAKESLETRQNIFGSDIKSKGKEKYYRVCENYTDLGVKTYLFLMDNPGLTVNDLSLHAMLCSCYIYCSLDTFIVNRCLG